MIPNSRQSLKNWCLRKLGDGVIKINISDAQAEDRIDEALEKFKEYHFDGSERIYLKRQVTASVLRFQTAVAVNTFTKGEKITGNTSGAVGKVYSQAADNLSVEFVYDSGSFSAGETITGADSSTAIVASSNFVTLGDKDNGWIPIDDTITSVIQLISSGGFSGGSLFSYNYQQAIQALPTFPSGGISYYYQQKQYMSLISQIFIGDKITNFQRIMNKLQISMDWKNGVNVGDYLILDAYKAVDPTEYEKVFNNIFVREYTTALFERQWGTNLTKYVDIKMLNGSTLNGEQIYNRATEKLAELETKLRDEYQNPPKFYMG